MINGWEREGVSRILSYHAVDAMCFSMLYPRIICIDQYLSFVALSTKNIYLSYSLISVYLLIRSIILEKRRLERLDSYIWYLLNYDTDSYL